MCWNSNRHLWRLLLFSLSLVLFFLKLFCDPSFLKNRFILVLCSESLDLWFLIVFCFYVRCVVELLASLHKFCCCFVNYYGEEENSFGARGFCFFMFSYVKVSVFIFLFLKFSDIFIFILKAMKNYSMCKLS